MTLLLICIVASDRANASVNYSANIDASAISSVEVNDGVNASASVNAS
jgi:hypothetical protein